MLQHYHDLKKKKENVPHTNNYIFELHICMYRHTHTRGDMYKTCNVISVLLKWLRPCGKPQAMEMCHRARACVCAFVACVLCGCANERNITVQRNKLFLNFCVYTFETFETLTKRVRAGRC